MRFVLFYAPVPEDLDANFGSIVIVMLADFGTRPIVAYSPRNVLALTKLWIHSVGR